MMLQRIFSNYRAVAAISAFLTLGSCIGAYYYVTMINDSNTGVSSVIVPIDDILRVPYTFKVDDPLLLKIIVDRFSKMPSKKAYNFDKKPVVASEIDDSPTWQEKEIQTLLNHKKNGLFVECGANNGQFLSNTRDLEVNYGWSGLLIEPNPDNFKKLLTRNRKATAVQACLSGQKYSYQTIMENNQILNKVQDSDVTNTFHKVQCFPLYSILLAFNMTKIDYFSLDIDSQETKVLRTIPWDKVNISTFSIEFNHVPEGKDYLLKFMLEKGYVLHLDGSKINHPQNIDFIFYHPQLIKIK